MSNQREELREALNDAVSGVHPKILEGSALGLGQGPITDFNDKEQKSRIFRIRSGSRTDRDYYEQAHINEELLETVVDELPKAEAIVRRGRPNEGVYSIWGDSRNSLFGAEIRIEDDRTDIAQGVASNVVWLSFSGLSRAVLGNVPPMPYWVVGVDKAKRRLSPNKLLVYPLRLNNLANTSVVGQTTDTSGNFDTDTIAKGSGHGSGWSERVVDSMDRLLDTVIEGTSSRQPNTRRTDAGHGSGARPIDFFPLDLYQINVNSRDLEQMQTSTRLLATSAMQGIVSPDGEIVLRSDSEGSMNNVHGSRLTRIKAGNTGLIKPSDPVAVRLTNELVGRSQVWEHLASLASDFGLAGKILDRL